MFIAGCIWHLFSMSAHLILQTVCYLSCRREQNQQACRHSDAKALVEVESGARSLLSVCYLIFLIATSLSVMVCMNCKGSVASTEYFMMVYGIWLYSVSSDT